MHSREYIHFNGARYERSSYFVGPRGKRLHVAVWEHSNGPVPEGHVVHHIDHNPLNNDLSNLVVMSAAEHQRHHQQNPDIVELVCEVCGNTFTSSRRTGRHCSGACKQRARKASGVDLVDRVCINCGDKFKTDKYRSLKCCSKSCGVTVGHRSRKRRLRPGD